MLVQVLEFDYAMERRGTRFMARFSSTSTRVPPILQCGKMLRDRFSQTLKKYLHIHTSCFISKHFFQTAEETKKWPYDFPLSADFPKANQRGGITGRLLVRDGRLTAAKQAYVGLAAPGNVGSWQEEIKVKYTN